MTSNGVANVLNSMTLAKGQGLGAVSQADQGFDMLLSSKTAPETDAGQMADYMPGQNGRTEEALPSYESYEKEVTKAGYRDRNRIASRSETGGFPKETREACEELEDKVTKLLGEKLGMTQEEVLEAMKAMGISLEGLLLGNRLTDFVGQLTGVQDATELLFRDNFQELLQQMEALAADFTEQTGMTPQELEAMLGQLEMESQGLPAETVEDGMQKSDLTQQSTEAVQPEKPAEQTAENITAEQTAENIARSQTEEQTATNQTAEQTARSQTEEQTARSQTAEQTATNQTEEQTATVQTEEQTATNQTEEQTARSQTAEQTATNQTEEQPATVQTEENVQNAVNQDETVSVSEKHGAGTQQSGQEADSQTGEQEADAKTQSSLLKELKQEESGIPKKTAAQNEPVQQVTYQTVQQTVSGSVGEQIVQTLEKSFVNVDDIMNQVAELTRVTVEQAQSSIEMQLNPAHLGKIYLQIVSKEGMITAQLAAQNEAVKEALESQAVVLKENMNQQGLKVEAVEVTIASHEFEQNLENDRRQTEQENGERQSRQSRRFLSVDQLEELSEAMTEEESLLAKIMLENGNSMDMTV